MTKFKDRPAPKDVDPIMWSNLMGVMDQLIGQRSHNEAPETMRITLDLPIDVAALALWKSARMPYYASPDRLQGPHNFSVEFPLHKEELVDLREELISTLSHWSDREFEKILTGRHDMLRPLYSPEDFKVSENDSVAPPRLTVSNSIDQDDDIPF